VALVEQVSEQVAAPRPLRTTTIVERAPAALVSEDGVRPALPVGPR
jgi:hypothetical protein